MRGSGSRRISKELRVTKTADPHTADIVTVLALGPSYGWLVLDSMGETHGPFRIDRMVRSTIRILLDI